MTTLVVLGAQWGDEGKGKIVDRLANEAHAVVRFQGGHNAGHTIRTANKEIALHLMPSGVLHPNAQCVIANGVVLSPTALLDETQRLESHGINLKGRLWISEACAVLLPSHQSLDMARERVATNKIGTTGRGIGPAYEDKVARRGLRWGDLWQVDWQQRILDLMDYHNFLLTEYYQVAPVASETVLADCERARARFDGMVEDVGKRLREFYEAGKNIMLEGAQGTALDLDHGTYPFVTSSHTTVGAASVGSGLGVHALQRIIGIAKAYVTRVGEGPMLTELSGQYSTYLQTRGVEIGTTTGRKRRCGWLDVVALRETARLNSMDALCLTKLDVLDGLDEVPICIEYRDEKGHCSPVYKNLPGWSTPISDINDWKALPKNAARFVETLEELIEVPIALVSVGPERDQTIVRSGSLWHIEQSL